MTKRLLSEPRERPVAAEGHEGEERESQTELRLAEMLKSFRRFMRECQSCQREAPPYWQFCAHCGARLATQCPGCGNPLPPSGARYCPHCGLEIPRAE